MPHPRFTLISRAISLFLALLLPDLPAHAQGSMSMSYFSDSSFEPSLSRSDLDVFIRVLKLKDAETQAMYDLYEGYAQTVRRDGQKVRTLMYDIMEESEIYADPGRLNKGSKHMQEWGTESEELKRAFVDDLKALLTREQEQRWPIVERELRRMKLFGGRLTGEDIDIVRIVNNLKLTDLSPAADQILEAYSQDLDRLLVQREAFITDNEPRFHELIKSDPPAAESIFLDALRIRIAIRDLNERTARQLADQLPPDPAAKLREQLENRTSSRAEIKSRAEALIKAAKDLDTITTAQLNQLNELSTWYAERLAPWKKSMADAIRRQEEEDRPISLLRAQGKAPPHDDNDYYAQWKLPPEHPVTKLRQERYELDKETRRKLLAILTDDQRASLPPGRSDYANFNDYRPGGL
ncbi:MAG: hypothetical protein IT435_06025 [Phycisphaerales bacterium]|nr:hypothetical protein [Phycisphaerales bacterium]